MRTRRVRALRFLAVWVVCAVSAMSAAAQSTQVGFGTVQDNSGLPVEVTADRLDVDQNTGLAIFRDNVVIVQGEMRLTANQVTVFYDNEIDAVERVEAIGDVVFVSGLDAAESDKADYYVATGILIMSGDVLVVQGPSAITSDEMTVYVDQGTAELTGRVRTVLQTEDND